MKEFNLTPVLSNSELMEEIKLEAKGRADQQVADYKNGNVNASYAYGKRGNTKVRSYSRMLEDHLIGCIGEYTGSVLTKCSWGKQRRQYSGNSKADLYPTYKGKKTRMEVRGIRSKWGIIFRQRDFKESHDVLLFGATNLPNGPNSKMGYLDFGTLKSLCKSHPEWRKTDDKGPPYYRVPIEYFELKESDFTQ